MTKKQATEWLVANMGTYLDHNGTEGKLAVYVPMNGEMVVAYGDSVEQAVERVQAGETVLA